MNPSPSPTSSPFDSGASNPSFDHEMNLDPADVTPIYTDDGSMTSGSDCDRSTTSHPMYDSGDIFQQDQRILLTGTGKLLVGYEEAAIVATQILLINALTKDECLWAEVHRSYHDEGSIFDQQSVLYCASWSSPRAQFEHMLNPKFSEAITNLCQFYEGNSIVVKRWKLLDCGIHSHPSRPVPGVDLAHRQQNAFCVLMRTVPNPCTQSLDFSTFLHECAMSARMEPQCIQFDVLAGDEEGDLGCFALYAVFRHRDAFYFHIRQEYSLFEPRGFAMCGQCVPEVSMWQRVELEDK